MESHINKRKRRWLSPSWQPRIRQRIRLSSVITAASLSISACIHPVPTVIDPSADPVITTGAVSPVTAGWETLAPGIERRVYRPENYALTQFIALRIDPAINTFRAHYRPGEPLTAFAWRDALPDALAIINANYFTAQNEILGLLISDGVRYGTAYSDRGGMLYVENGAVGVRSTISEPYLGEAFEQAVQAFPMLVSGGQQAFSNTRGDRIARRTIAGQDSSGRIILMVTSSLAGMRLVDMSAYLPATDLDLVEAFNLDGGGSTLMIGRGGAETIFVPSFDAVPAVLAVYPR